VIYPPPAPATGLGWYDVAAVNAALFARLRLLVDDVDAQRVTETVTAAGEIVEQYMDAEELWADSALTTEALLVVAVNMYQGTDPDSPDPWGLKRYLSRRKQRWGVA
jgi:hypothetical protein